MPGGRISEMPLRRRSIVVAGVADPGSLVEAAVSAAI